jgi:hypothetical protein
VCTSTIVGGAGLDGAAVAGKSAGSRAPGAVSVVLVLAASLLALVGGITLFLREEVLDSSAFADRAVQAVQQPTVQHVVARQITVRVIEPALPDLIAGRSLISSAVRVAVTSKPFARVIRLAALHGHRLLFERHGGNAVFDIADAGSVIASALRKISPKLASELPKRADAVLLTLRKRSFASTTLRVAEAVRLLGFILPPVALALYLMAIVIAPDRRRALTRSAVGFGVTGVVFAIAFALFRRYVVSDARGAGELSNADVRGALDELWGAYLGDLMTWTLVLTAIAWVLAAASSSVLAPYSPAEGIAWLRARTPRPASDRARAARGALVLALGVFVVLRPTLALRIVAVLGGFLLVYVGLGELLSAVAPAQPRVKGRPRIARRQLVAGTGLAAACAAAIGIAFALTGGASKAQARTATACNGYPQLCTRRLDEVVFAGTHNSMSAADSPGWLIANQDRTIAQQLNDGIRLFKISTHYGVKTPTGQVYTDIAAAGNRVNRVAERLEPSARVALQRLSRSLHRGSPNGTRDIWLCHSLCELGATRMLDFLSVIHRFLKLNPDQVIVLFDEDYVSEQDLRSTFKRAGLFSRLARLQAGQPLPTLAALIQSRHNIVVFAQDPTSGRYPWNAAGFSWIQDTPLGAKKPGEFTCKLNRGHSTNPLLMMNDWADIFPPRPTPNVPLVQRSFILQRARQCDQQRGQIPNLILTDFYNRGQVVQAVAQLNGVATEKPAAITPVESG